MDVRREQGEPTGGDADLSVIAGLIAEPARAKALIALADGRWLPASMLAQEAGVASSTMSSHLARLVDGGMLTVETRGRFRYFRLADPRIAELVELMSRIAPRLTISSLRADTRARALRRARRCYDHLGGRLAVAISTALARQGYLAAAEPDRFVGGDTSPVHVLDSIAVTLTPAGAEFFERFDVTLPAGTSAKCCVDWTEHRHHLAGAPGRGILTMCERQGWVEPTVRPRALKLTAAGRRALEDRLGFDLSEEFAA